MSFTRLERIGLICLCGLVLVLLSVRVSLPYWVHPTENKEEEQKLIAAWEQFKRNQPKPKPADSTSSTTSDFQDTNDEGEVPLPAIVDINTVDSETLVRFRGIGPATAGKIVTYMKANGPFTDINQLLEIRSFPKETFEMLKKHLVVGGNHSQSEFHK